MFGFLLKKQLRLLFMSSSKSNSVGSSLLSSVLCSAVLSSFSACQYVHQKGLLKIQCSLLLSLFKSYFIDSCFILICQMLSICSADKGCFQLSWWCLWCRCWWQSRQSDHKLFSMSRGKILVSAIWLNEFWFFSCICHRNPWQSCSFSPPILFHPQCQWSPHREREWWICPGD